VTNRLVALPTLPYLWVYSVSYHAFMKSATLAHLVVFALTLIGLCSCGVDSITTGTEPTQFLKSTGTDIAQRVQRLPFEHSWRDPKVDLTKYKNIVVRPVTTSFLRTEKWGESKSTWIPSKRSYLKRCAKLSRHWNKALSKSFSSPLCMFYQLKNPSQPDTLILEIALTEVRFDPTVPAAGAQASVATGNLTSVVTGIPICAFEARVRDAATGKLISTAADRRGPQFTVIDPEKKSVAKPNERICEEWSDQLMKSSNIELFPKVHRSWFSFL
jgi:Protein of unknown function (DUF3313)